MIRNFSVALCLSIASGLGACVVSGSQGQVPQPRQARAGQYVYPQQLRPEPRQFSPQADDCGARLYQGLVGQHMGGIHLAGIGGDKRIIKPAELETSPDDFLPDMNAEPPRLDVREMLAGQPLYASSVRTGLYPGQIGNEQQNRLTIELDAAGYVTRASCG